MKCSFCGTSIPKGTGKIFATKDGSAKYYCSHKCEKNNLKLGRKSSKTKWTNAYHKAKKQQK